MEHYRGFENVDDYYQRASPLKKLLTASSEKLPKTLLIHSLDDPWVPSESVQILHERISCGSCPLKVETLLTKYGGHNGFHGLKGCWGDEVVKRWLMTLAN